MLLQLKTTSTLDQNRGANICHGGVPVNVCLTLRAPNLLFYMLAPDLLSLFDRFNLRAASTSNFALHPRVGRLLTG